MLQEMGSKLAEAKRRGARAQELLPRWGGDPFPRRYDIELPRREEFSYDAGREVVRGVSLRIAQGRIAIVGRPARENDAGRARQQPRFYDPDSGQVLIGGKDVRSIDYDDLLAHVAVVFQKTFLTRAAASSNIGWGSAASIEDVRRAARRLYLHR